MGGYILADSGKREAALEFYRRALGFKVDLPIAWSNVGKLMFEDGRYAEALDSFDAALGLTPKDADLWNSRAGALRKLGRLEQSAAAAREALRLKPRFAEAALNLGTALLKLDRCDEALAAYEAAGDARPGYGAALNGQALALRALGRIDEARAAFEAAEALGNREAVSGRGCLDLMLGDFERGWEGYEARWVDGKSLAEALGARFPKWRGPGLAGERVLVMNDHGFGDTIQFCRYLPLMAAAGAEPTFLCPPRLRRLLASLAGDSPDRRTVAGGTLRRPDRRQQPAARFRHPARHRAGCRSPISPPSLSARGNGRRASAPRASRSASSGRAIRIPRPTWRARRRSPLSRRSPRLPACRLISLQIGYGVEQLADLPAGMRVETLGDDFDAGPDGFVDTAAAMTALDLVVTCDTSVAHLAGALARPTWVALKQDAEWRWLRDRDDSPWYPTMRLFRQTRRGDWSDVFAAMAAELAALVPSGGAGRTIDIPGAVGELIDKIAILKIKERRIDDPDKVVNVRRELALLDGEARRGRASTAPTWRRSRSNSPRSTKSCGTSRTRSACARRRAISANGSSRWRAPSTAPTTAGRRSSARSTAAATRRSSRKSTTPETPSRVQSRTA